MYQFYGPMANLKLNPILDKIGHIRMYKNYTGTSLMESKQAVEKLITDGKLVAPEVNDKSFRSALEYGQRVQHFYYQALAGSVDGYEFRNGIEFVFIHLDDGRYECYRRDELVPEILPN